MKTILTGIQSDAHTWNLSYMELFLTEQGLDVMQAGPNRDPADIVTLIAAHQAPLVIISTVNGHGYIEAPGFLQAIHQARLGQPIRVMIGGLLSTHPQDNDCITTELLQMGFDGVYTGDAALINLQRDLQYYQSLGHNETSPVAMTG